MRSLLVCALMLLLTSGLAFAAQNDRIVRYNFPVWEGVTDLSGDALYPKLFELVFGAAGYETVREPAGDIPWKKGIRNIVLEQTDTTGGEYSRLIKERGLTHPQVPILMTNIYAVYRAQTFPDGLSPEAVKGKRVVENLGFQLAKVLGFDDVETMQAPNEHSTGKMLLRERADLILYEEYHYVSATEQAPALTKPPFKAEIHATMPMFLMFPDSERGKALAKAWDEGFRRLQTEGRLNEAEALYKKYGMDFGMPDFAAYLK